MAAEVTVEAALPHEAEAVLDLWRRSDAEPSPTDTKIAVLRLIRDNGSLLVARGPDLLVGTIVAGWDGWRGNLYRLVVLPEFRRQGVGRLLVREAERNLRARGCTRVTALVQRDCPCVPAAQGQVCHDAADAPVSRGLSRCCKPSTPGP